MRRLFSGSVPARGLSRFAGRLISVVVLVSLTGVASRAETIPGFANPLDVTSGNPNVFQKGDTYYLLNRNSRMVSKDLVHWRDGGNWVSFKAMARADVRGMWASFLIEKDGKYYFYFSAGTSKSKGLHVLCVATSDSIDGDFQIVAAPIFSDGNGYIDPFVFQDPKSGDYFMYYTFQQSNEGSGKKARVYGVKLKESLVEIDLSTKTLCIEPSQDWELRWQEAVHVLMHNDLYYMEWSTCVYSGPNYRVGYATATSPLGPWKKAAENPILLRKDLPEGSALGTGAMCLVDSPDHRELLGLYFSHIKSNTQGGRQLNLDRIVFEPNGSSPDRMVVNGPTLAVQAWPSGVKPPEVILGEDSFTGDALSDRWVNIWHRDDKAFTVSDGKLQIIPSPGAMKPVKDAVLMENIFLQYAPQKRAHRISASLSVPEDPKVFGYIQYWQDARNFLMLKLTGSNQILVEQMVNDKVEFTKEFSPAAKSRIDSLGLYRSPQTRKVQLGTKSGNSAWVLVGEVDDKFYDTKPLKCGLGAGTTASRAGSPVLFDSFQIE